jgi:hypothetical protein
MLDALFRECVKERERGMDKSIISDRPLGMARKLTPPCNSASTHFKTLTTSREPSTVAEASLIPHAVRRGCIELGTIRPKPAVGSGSQVYIVGCAFKGGSNG